MSAHYEGEILSGGVIFHIYTTTGGTEECLIVSQVNIDDKMIWSNVQYSFIGNTSIWDGELNTTNIINQNGHYESAALKCREYSDGGWYLPSAIEMRDLDRSIYEVNYTLSHIPNSDLVTLEGYWTSTEYSDKCAYVYFFDESKLRYDGFLKNTEYKVRAIKRIQL
jgi:hypothetical protein